MNPALVSPAVLFLVLVGALFFGALGYAIGAPLKMGFAGFGWGMAMGPVGLIIIALLTIREKMPDPALLLHRPVLLPSGPAPVLSGVVPGGGGTMMKLRIARGEQELGKWNLPAVRGYLASGELTLEDTYFDGAAGEWLPLAAHLAL